jgi:hypothetical protein
VQHDGKHHKRPPLRWVKGIGHTTDLSPSTPFGYLSIEHAGQWADVSVTTIKRWIKRGLPTHQAGPREKLLIRPADIQAFLAQKNARWSI